MAHHVGGLPGEPLPGPERPCPRRRWRPATSAATTRVTYSTCSVHVRENEAVVATALGGPGGRAGGWALEAALPAWHRRGLAGAAPGLTDAEAACLVRVDPEADETDGFFVALFVRGEQK